jgi:sirohydrochlorin ferrochelatase
MRPPRLSLGVVLVAHGSRDPRAAAATSALARAVGRAHPGWAVRAAYLDHAGPRPLDALASLPVRRAVVVPLLLT